MVARSLSEERDDAGARKESTGDADPGAVLAQLVARTEDSIVALAQLIVAITVLVSRGTVEKGLRYPADSDHGGGR